MILNLPNAQSFNTVPHVVVIPKHEIISLPLHGCNFVTVMTCNVDICYVTCVWVTTHRLRTTALITHGSSQLKPGRSNTSSSLLPFPSPVPTLLNGLVDQCSSQTPPFLSFPISPLLTLPFPYTFLIPRTFLKEAEEGEPSSFLQVSKGSDWSSMQPSSCLQASKGSD